MWCTKRDLWTHLFRYRTSHPSILLGNKTTHYIPTVFKNFFLYNFPFLHTIQTLHTQQDFTHTRLTFSDLAIYIYLCIKYQLLINSQDENVKYLSSLCTIVMTRRCFLRILDFKKDFC